MECERALDNVKDAYRRTTEEAVVELIRIKNPPVQLQEVCTKFYLMVNGQEVNWAQFKEFGKNFNNFRE
eukprot:CAMPEP_0202975520 /NCGR_PEP_ID=MMETSP1396-20130829/69778_1 /ASSEMBLY_ACC=CAM_ASM_000872 /TAXON_ID= /ORGANISM="Pseudokeronopsis sp., Strain Brazil" /LENGTH=68 /DNA_ID=CAMNT_0049711241 /DNA_START=43 /DNA_END=249 /DNA_ORIENTATION=+